MEDPVFHLALPSQVFTKGFTEVPDNVLQACHVAVKPDGAYRYWLLAAAEAPDGHYLMIGGMVQAHAGRDAWSNDAHGSFLRLSANQCTAIDPADEVFANYRVYADDPDMHIGRPVFASLAHDAVARFTHAFGSREALLEALREQHKLPEKDALALLRDALHGE